MRIRPYEGEHRLWSAQQPAHHTSNHVEFIGERGETACPVSLLDLQTGSGTTWQTFRPPDAAGVVGVAYPRIAAEEQHYLFGYVRDLSDLFLVDHLK